MKTLVAIPISACCLAVSRFRGTYARVARELGVDVSYISRIARGERKSRIAERALDREFNKILGMMKNSASQPVKTRDRQTGKKGSPKLDRATR